MATAPWFSLQCVEFFQATGCGPTVREARQRLLKELGFDSVRIAPAIVEVRSRTRVDYVEHLQVVAGAGFHSVIVEVSPKMAARLTATKLCNEVCTAFDSYFTS